VWANRIFITTGAADGEKRGIAAFDRATGEKLWETFAPDSNKQPVNLKNGHASSTPTTDGHNGKPRGRECQLVDDHERGQQDDRHHDGCRQLGVNGVLARRHAFAEDDRVPRRPGGERVHEHVGRQRARHDNGFWPTATMVEKRWLEPDGTMKVEHTAVGRETDVS
jgi:hypothetical protein